MQRQAGGNPSFRFGLTLTAATVLMTALAFPSFAGQPMTSPTLQWSELPPLPDPVGFAGPLVGVSGDALIVAGGANFPKGRPWNGDPKAWYDTIHVLTDPKGSWRIAQEKLPRPMGYAVALSYGDGIVCVGGDAGDRHFADAFVMTWKDGRVRMTGLPPLPSPVAYASGAIVGHTIYVAGGAERPGATAALSSVYSLDLDVAPDEQVWTVLPRWDGPPRMLAVAGAHDGAFYLFSGTSLFAGEDGKPDRKFLRDAHRYTPGKGWQRLADLPRPAIAAPTPAPLVGGSRLLVIGGDTGEYFARNFQLKDQHPGFPSSILAYDTAADSWSEAGEFPTKRGRDPDTNPNGSVWAPVTTGATIWRGRIVIPSGEARPGVRTPRVFWAEIGRSK